MTLVAPNGTGGPQMTLVAPNGTADPQMTLVAPNGIGDHDPQIRLVTLNCTGSSKSH